MPVPTHLLERAHQLINANQPQNAELLLDAVVRVDPQNVEAWKTYLMIHQSQNDLDWLKERILKTKELSEVHKTRLVDYYLYLTKNMNGAEEIIIRINSFPILLQEEKDKISMSVETTLQFNQFELIDVFDYPSRFVKNETRTRPRRKPLRKPRRRAIYNPFPFPFPFDITGDIFKAILGNSFGMQIRTHVQKIIILINDLIKNPKDIYNIFSKSPYFEKYTEVALLALFILGIRLVISNHFFGYIFLGMFFVGGRWWLLNFGNHNITGLNNQTRVYLHENKNKLPMIKELEIDQKKPVQENTEKTIK